MTRGLVTNTTRPLLGLADQRLRGLVGQRMVARPTSTEIVFTPPLDQIAPASAAFSLRRIRSAYTGPAVRVRRFSDNAEADIGFTSAGNLNTVDLLAFCGTSSGFVTTWYDQSGNVRNLTQATQSAQPRIVNAGAYESAVNFNASTFSMSVSGIPSTYRASVVGAPLGSGAFRTLLWAATSQHPFLLDTGSTAAGVYNSTAFFGAGSLTWGASELATFWIDGATSTFALGKNGGATSSTGTSLSSTIPAVVGNASGGGGQQFGPLSELVFLSAAATSNDRQLLERNQGAYYGITVA